MSIAFREAVETDLPRIVALLKDDVLGRGRESDDLDHYRSMFRQIATDHNNHLIVGETGGFVVACYQLTFIPGFTLNGTRRAEIEGVRIARELRGSGYGKALIADAESRAVAGGAGLLQLTMNSARAEVRAFYEQAGFVASHIGFKKPL